MAGPRTWTLVRELYLSGLTAEEVSARTGVGVAAMRRRMGREGWTRTAQAEGVTAGAHPLPAAAPQDEEPDDGEALDPVALAHAVGRRAARALAAGRTAEAAALARTGEQVLAFLDRLPPPPEDEEGLPQLQEAWVTQVWNAASRLAEQLLKEGHTPAVHARAALRWRADNLGPEVAEADRRRAQADGWAASVYDEHGALRPPQSFAEFSAAWDNGG